MQVEKIQDGVYKLRNRVVELREANGQIGIYDVGSDKPISVIQSSLSLSDLEKTSNFPHRFEAALYNAGMI